MTGRLTTLNAEWEVLAGHVTPEEWHCRPALAGVGRLAELEAAVRADPDGVLLALLEEQGYGDALAGRAVLQLLLGKLVTMAARDPQADLGDYLAAAWERVATYPRDRRPRRVAANLVLDTLKTVVGRRGSRASAVAAGTVVDDKAICGAPNGLAPDAEARAVIDEGVDRGLIDAATARTLRVVYLEGRTSRAAADELGTTADAVRWRCSRGVRALRAASVELADALAG